MPLAKVGLLARQGELAKGHSNASSQQVNGTRSQNFQRSSSSSMPVDDPRSHGDSSAGTLPADYGPLHANHTQSSAQCSKLPISSADSLLSARTSPSSIVMVSRPASSGTDGIALPTMRHGFGEAYSSEEYLTMLEQV
jgi:hypothetical protein